MAKLKAMRLRCLIVVLACLPAAARGQDVSCDLLSQSGRSELEKHQYGAAASEFARALNACPEERGILLELAEAYAHNRDFSSAIHVARTFLESNLNSLPGILTLANVYFMARQFSESRAECERALKLAPGDPAALKLLGNIEYLSGADEDAESTFVGLLDLHPDDDEAAYMLGRVYYMQGRIDHAAGQFQRVLKINPGSYKAYDNLGLCYQALGKTELAIRYFLTSIKMVEKDHPEYDWPYANLADLLLENNELEKAFSAASKAADRNPVSARNFYLGGKALCKLQKTDLCINWLERSTALDPNYPEPLYLLSKAYAQAGLPDKAKTALEKFSEVKARAPRVRR